MNRPSGVVRVLGLGLQAAGLTAFLAPLLTRLVIGLAFYQTGRGKLENFEGTAAFFGELGIPLPELNAAFVSRLEYYGGMLLIAITLFGLHLLLGGSGQVMSKRDLVGIALYVTAFAIGGAFVGLLRPNPKRRASVYFAMAGAGAIAMNIIAILDRGTAPPAIVEVLVLSGIEPGDEVVTDGVFFLRAERERMGGAQ